MESMNHICLVQPSQGRTTDTDLLERLVRTGSFLQSMGLAKHPWKRWNDIDVPDNGYHLLMNGKRLNPHLKLWFKESEGFWSSCRCLCCSHAHPGRSQKGCFYFLRWRGFAVCRCCFRPFGCFIALKQRLDIFNHQQWSDMTLHIRACCWLDFEKKEAILRNPRKHLKQVWCISRMRKYVKHLRLNVL